MKNAKRIMILFLVVAVMMGVVALPASAVDTSTLTEYFFNDYGEVLAEAEESVTPDREPLKITGYTYKSQSTETIHVYAEHHLTYVIGYPDGGVKVEQHMTRAEAATVLYRLYNGRIPAFIARMSNDTFTDVNSGEWYYKEVETLYNTGVILDSENGVFRPNEPITRAEFAIMAARYQNLSYADRAIFADVPIGHYAYSYINAAADKGWVKGYPDGTFRPENKITRAEVMTLVNRLFNRPITLDELPPNINPYNDITESHWAFCEAMEATIQHDTVAWHGTHYNDGIFNVVYERFVDLAGEEIAEKITTNGRENNHPVLIHGHNYLGYITEVTYVYTSGQPVPSIEKTNSKALANVGDVVTYTVKLKNDSTATDAWADIVLTDELSEYVSLEHGSVYIDNEHAEYSYSDNVLKLGVGNIAIGKEVIVKFDVLILSNAYGKTFYNTAVAKGSNGSADDSDESISDTDDGITVNEGRIMPTLVKTANSSTVAVGDTITYTLDVSNLSRATFAWKNAVLTDTIPDGLEYVDGSVYVDGRATTNYSFKGGKLTIELGDIEPGESHQVTFKTKVLSSAYDSTIYNVAIGTGDNIDEVRAPDEGVVVPAGVAMPSAEKKADKKSVGIGETITYTINASNDERATAAWEEVIITDIIPEHVTFIYGSVMVEGNAKTYSFNPTTRKLSIGLGDIPAGQTVEVTFAVTADDTTYNREVHNLAVLTSDNCDDVEARDDIGVTVYAGGVIPNAIKKANKSQSVVGDTLTYSITASNSSLATATWEKAIVKDAIPESLTFVYGSVQIDGKTAIYSYDSSSRTLTVELGDIKPNASTTVTFAATVNAGTYGTTIYNVAVLSGDNVPELEAEDSGVIITDGIAVPSVTKEVNKTSTNVGDTITYTVKASNSHLATIDWKDVVLTDEISDYLAFTQGSVQVNGVTAPYSFSNGKLSVSVGNIAPAKSVTITFDVIIKDTAYNTTVYNTAVMNGSNTPDPVEADADGVVVGEGISEGTATKSVSATHAMVGDTLTYTIEVKNSKLASFAWENAVINDSIPEHLTFVEGSLQINNKASSDYSYDGSSELRVFLGDMQPGEVAAVTFRVTVDKEAEGEFIVNTAYVSGDNHETLTAPDNGVQIGAKAPMPIVSKRASTSKAAVGDTITYTVRATNDIKAPVEWQNVVMSDTIPLGMDFVDGSVYVGGILTNYTFAERILTVPVGNIVPGETVEITFKVVVSEDARGNTIENVAMLDSDNHDSVPAPDKGIKIDEGNPVPTVTKAASVAEAKVGDSVTYTIYVENSITATADWRNVIVTDVIPGEFDFKYGSVFINGKSANYTYSGRALTVPAGDLIPGQSATVSISVTVTERALGKTIFNTATVSSDNHTPETSTDDGVKIPDEEYGVGSGDDRELYGSKIVDKVSVRAGETLTYTIVAGNSSENNFTWHDIEMYDIIDTSKSKIIIDTVTIDGRKANTAERSYSNGQLIVHLGSMEPGQEKTITFQVLVTSEANGELISNTASLKGSNADGGTFNTTVRINLKTPVPVDPDPNLFSDIHMLLYNGFGFTQTVTDSKGNKWEEIAGHWMPDNYMSKAELAGLYWRLMCKPEITKRVNLADVETSYWAYDPIQYALERKILFLDLDSNFNIYDRITQADFGRMLQSALGSDFGFTSSAPITRLETAIEIVKHTSRTVPPVTNGHPLPAFPDVPSTHPYYWTIMEVSTDHDWYLDSHDTEYWD